MYRPTVRYHDVYQDYVNDLFKATRLDRNQIFRLALYAAAHSDVFHSILSKYKRGDVPLPFPNWTVADHDLWLENIINEVGKGSDVNGINVQRGAQIKTAYTTTDRGGINTSETSHDRSLCSMQRTGREGEISTESSRRSIRVNSKGIRIEVNKIG